VPAFSDVVESISWHPDGTRFALTTHETDGPHKVSVHDSKNGARVACIDGGDVCPRVAWTVSGDYLAIGGAGSVAFMAIDRQTHTHQFEGTLIPAPQDTVVLSIERPGEALHPEVKPIDIVEADRFPAIIAAPNVNRRVVVRAEDQTLQILDNAGRHVASLPSSHSSLTDIALSSDGRHIIARKRQRATFFSHALTQTLLAWDVATGKRVSVITGVPSTQSSFCVNSLSQGIVGRGRTGIVRVFSKHNGRQRRVLSINRKARHGGALRGGAISPDGSVVALSGDDSDVHLFGVATGERLRVLRTQPGKREMWGIALDRSGDIVATADRNKVGTLWRGTQIVSQFKVDCEDSPLAIAIDPSGRFLVHGDSKNLVARSTSTGQVAWVVEQALSGPLSTVAFGSSRGLLVTGDMKGTAAVWELETGEVVAKFSNAGNAIRRAVLSPNAGFLATGGYDRSTTRMWDVPARRVLWERESTEKRGSAFVEFSSDSLRLATTGNAGTASVYDVLSGSLIRTFKIEGSHEGLLTRFIAQNTCLLVMSESCAEVWAIDSWKCRLRTPRLPATAMGAFLSEDASVGAFVQATEGRIEFFNPLAQAELRSPRDLTPREMESLILDIGGQPE
jgi:WD40 repeat protein